MDIFVSILVVVGIYFLLGIVWLSPFLLSARISRKEEDNS